MPKRILHIVAAVAAVVGLCGTAQATTLIGGTTSATGIDDLVVQGANYGLTFVDANNSYFNAIYGTGGVPQFNWTQSFMNDVANSLRTWEMSNQFTANSDNDLLALVYTTDGTT